MPEKTVLTSYAEWKRLEDHAADVKKLHLRELFSDPGRFDRFSVEDGDPSILLDYSRNLVTEETMKMLMDLADACNVKEQAQRMFSGEKINFTENRAVLHTALRNFSSEPVNVDEMDVMPSIRGMLDRIEKFSDSIRDGSRTGKTGKRIKDIVNIGIGGSDLGPAMACDALSYYADGPQVHFVSNVDAADISETLKKLHPETTLFIVVSKSFTTAETLANANTARDWILQTIDKEALPGHFAAVTANPAAAVDFGIDEDSVFEIWDFVGGRYSVWSATGLSIALSVGFDRFRQMLEGANAMDRHFLNSPYRNNIPVILAMLGIWYRCFMGAQTHAVVPYSRYLRRLPAYLQQLEMESNGKCVDANGQRVNYTTAPVIWGQCGTDAQHSFFQMLHQGCGSVPVDLIGFAQPLDSCGRHHEMLISNMFAQGEALAFGQDQSLVESAMKKDGISPDDIARIEPYRSFEGNRPSSTIMSTSLTPAALGALIAMYEHKVFVQGVVWKINSFDQYGVELGKKLANVILSEIEHNTALEHDSSTRGLIKWYLGRRGQETDGS